MTADTNGTATGRHISVHDAMIKTMTISGKQVTLVVGDTRQLRGDRTGESARLPGVRCPGGAVA